MVQLSPNDTLTNSQWLVSLAEVPNIYWTMASAIETTVERGTYVDPIAAVMRNTRSGAVKYSDVTLTKSFDNNTDWDLLGLLIGFRDAGQYLSASMSPVIRNNGIQLLGNRRIDMENLMVKSVASPGEIDVGDGATVSTLTAVFTMEYLRFETAKTTD